MADSSPDAGAAGAARDARDGDVEADRASSSPPSETIQTAAFASPQPSQPLQPSPSSPLSQSPSRASVPPSEPRSTSRASFSQVDLSADRPARLQMIVALILGLVLVAIPLYLWRRPRAESIAVSSTIDAGETTTVTGGPGPAVVDDTKPTLGEARTILCQDPGPRKTAPEQCDHVVEVEKALARAIEETASCVPRDAGGGTVQYVVDVSFKRKGVGVSTPKDARSMKNVKVVAACQAAVKGKLQTLSLDAVQHAHQRYKIAITATYVGPVK